MIGVTFYVASWSPLIVLLVWLAGTAIWEITRERDRRAWLEAQRMVVEDDARRWKAQLAEIDARYATRRGGRRG